MSALLSPQEENRLLQQELSRVEDLLAQSRAERDELAIKYNAISERVRVGATTDLVYIPVWSQGLLLLATPHGRMVTGLLPRGCLERSQ